MNVRSMVAADCSLDGSIPASSFASRKAVATGRRQRSATPPGPAWWLCRGPHGQRGVGVVWDTTVAWPGLRARNGTRTAACLSDRRDDVIDLATPAAVIS